MVTASLKNETNLVNIVTTKQMWRTSNVDSAVIVTVEHCLFIKRGSFTLLICCCVFCIFTWFCSCMLLYVFSCLLCLHVCIFGWSPTHGYVRDWLSTVGVFGSFRSSSHSTRAEWRSRSLRKFIPNHQSASLSLLMSCAHQRNADF